MAVEFSRDTPLSVEITIPPGPDRRSLFGDTLPTLETLESYRPDPDRMRAAAMRLEAAGVPVLHVGAFSISVSPTVAQYEKLFETQIVFTRFSTEGTDQKDYIILAPEVYEPWTVTMENDLHHYIETAYIQQPRKYFAGESPRAPQWQDKFRLNVPHDIARLTQASKVHDRGITGAGVQLAMLDSGFYPHPYFIAQGYRMRAIAAPDQSFPEHDSTRHGTPQCANLLAVAPGVDFLGIKIKNETLAFKFAMEQKPDIVSSSWGCLIPDTRNPMPNQYRPLLAAVLDATARGITLCFSAGNGACQFPASIPCVIGVGGVYADEHDELRASDYASSFRSAWFPDRCVPDVCGLCGMDKDSDYIILPVQEAPQGSIHQGWRAMSGTSAACAMVAGVCALLKEVEPGLSPAEIKTLLCTSARDIVNGNGRLNGPTTRGVDLPTGYGMVDAHAALSKLRSFPIQPNSE